MRVCLISPPMTVVSPDWNMPQVPPLGIAYLAACARGAGHEVQVVDGLGEAIDQYHEFIQGHFLNGLSLDELVRRVDPTARVIGLSVMFSKQWPMARRLLALLRQSFPGTALVAGGEHITAAIDHVFDSAPLDYAVLGEGEETFLELLDAIEVDDNDCITRIEGLAYSRSRVECAASNGATISLKVLGFDEAPQAVRDDTKTCVVRTPRRKRRREIDSIPWPAWDLIPLRAYIDTNHFQECSDRRVMIMLGTRGCPYKCRFCSNPQMWSTNFYMRDPVDLVDELELYSREYGATEFQFQDLTFVINRRWVIRVAEEIIRRRLDITWKLPGGTRSEAFDVELFHRFKESGCTSLTFAPESGSKRVLEAMLKEADPDRFVELGRMVHNNRIDLNLTFFIIIGSPEETLRDLLQTYVFIARLAAVGYDAMLCSRFTCYPGSDYHQRYLDQGNLHYDDEYFLDLDLSLRNLRNGRSWHPRWSKRHIRWAVICAYAWFYGLYYVTRPARIARSFMAVVRSQPTSRIEVVLSETLQGWAERLWIKPRRRQPVDSMSSA